MRALTPSSHTPLVCVVDDDQSVRESLPPLLRSYGHTVRAFPSARQFLASNSLLEVRCLILDVAMPGMTGPELHRELRRRRLSTPVIYITAHSADSAFDPEERNLAVACLTKPFSESALLQAVEHALTTQ